MKTLQEHKCSNNHKGNEKTLLVFLFLYFLSSCSNGETISQKEKITNSEITNAKTIISADKQEADTIKYDFCYFLPGDTLSRMLYIKVLNKRKDDNMPSQLGFGLAILDKHREAKRFLLQGVAKLTSPNESFSDNASTDEGDYFAADYMDSKNDYKVKIRMDIEKYEACVVSVTCNDSKKMTETCNYFPNKYPDYDVMKKGDCNYK